MGASGFVGKYVAEALKPDFKVIKTSRSKREGFLKFDVLNDRMSNLVTQVNLCPEDSFIILCNKFGPMEKYPLDSEYAQKCEVESVEKIAEDCSRINIPVVYLSTSYVFSGSQSGYLENSPTNPVSLYGRLKLDAEQQIKRYNKNNLILRLDKVVGTQIREAHLFSEWYKDALSGNEIKCIKGQNFSPTFVKDIALAVKLCLLKRLNGLYHCVNNENWGRAELATKFFEIVGVSAVVSEYSQEDLGLVEQRPRWSNLNSEKLINTIGFEFTPMTKVMNYFNNSLT